MTEELLDTHRFGGIITVGQANSLEEALASLSEGLPAANPIFDATWLSQLQEYLTTAEELLPPGFEGIARLKYYMDCRARLVPVADMLTAAPLTTLLAQPDILQAARDTVAAYEGLMEHISSHFAQLQQEDGAQLLGGLLLRLDLVEVRDGMGGRAGLLAPFHPLILWKNIELADEVLAGHAADLRLLIGRLSLFSEPLRALMLPVDESYTDTALAYADRLGSWAVYRPAGLVNVTVSIRLLERAAEKIAILYPPVRQHLRLFLHHPESLERVTEVLRHLFAPKKGHTPFEHVQLIISHHPDTPIKLDGLNNFISEGLVTPELKSAVDADEIVPWLVDNPVHILVLPGQRYLQPTRIGRQASNIHPLSLPRLLQFNQFKKIISLQPRSQQGSSSGASQPFGPYHALAAALGGQPQQELSGTLVQQENNGSQTILMPHAVFMLLAGATGVEGAQVLAREGGIDGDVVVTHYPKRFVKGVEYMLRELNYQPDAAGVLRLLKRLETVGETGLFKTISDTGVGGFSPPELKGQFGLAVALGWYLALAGNDPRHLTVSLDSELAKRWLEKRDSDRRNDLLGMRRLENGRLSIDLIEVKSYKVGANIEGDGHPGEQLRAVARALFPVLEGKGGDLLTDCRRELLREQLFREGQLTFPKEGVTTKEWGGWIQLLNDTLDGELSLEEGKIEVNLMLIEVCFEENIERSETIVQADAGAQHPADRLPVHRVRLGESDVKLLLGSDWAAPVTLPTVTVPAPVKAQPKGAQAAATPAPKPTVIVADPIVAPKKPDGPEKQGEDDSEVTGTTPLPDAPIAPASGGSSAPIPPEAVLGEEEPAEPTQSVKSTADLEALAAALYRALQNFGQTPKKPIDPQLADVGPTVIRFKIETRVGQQLNKIQARALDLQREMELEKPPVIYNLRGYIAVDIPRPDPQAVLLKDVLASSAKKKQELAPISFPAGVAPDGDVPWLSIPLLPHMLVGGTSRSGKTMFLYSIIVSLTKLNTPDELKIVLIDPKRTDFNYFSSLPHLYNGEILTDKQQAMDVLQDLLNIELERRTDVLVEHGCRDIQDLHRSQPQIVMPYVIVVIDEFADLSGIMDKKQREAFDMLLGRVAQRARSVGIHLIIATQRPDAKVIFGNLKANLLCRVAFQLTSGIDSRIILDENGAEDLIGYGDMLLKIEGRIQRLQGFFISTDELRKLKS
ncbi:DNA translocase FtsK [Hymenobacter jeollabukensis]|uniref:DNA translocase FtsK n=1 Tax=Hymenobacter jeollabukensis TaxID=2025313 RepID=UPI001BB10A5A|nr:DNA translocase FtsK [Hymenobacter jeollabukensis]